MTCPTWRCVLAGAIIAFLVTPARAEVLIEWLFLPHGASPSSSAIGC